MTHTLTTYNSARHFDTTLIADDAIVSNPFVLTTITFPILRRTENFLTKQSIRLITLSTVVNCFWLGHFTC